MILQGNAITKKGSGKNGPNCIMTEENLLNLYNLAVISVAMSRAKSLVRGRREKKRTNDYFGVDSSVTPAPHTFFLSLAKISLMTDISSRPPSLFLSVMSPALQRVHTSVHLPSLYLCSSPFL